jgi:hypothetical protein
VDTRGTGTALRGWGAAALLAGALVLGGCGTPTVPSDRSPTTGDESTAASASPGGQTSSPSESPGASPTDSPMTPTPTPATDPTGTGLPVTPGSSATAGPASPSPSVSQAGCADVTPVRVDKVDSQPRRTTEVVTVVSDGKSLTSGTREQQDFLTPTLQGPDGTSVTDETTVKKVAALTSAAGRHPVLLTRPEAPDSGASADRRPFDVAGTYVLFNASAPLVAQVVVTCGGQDQRWTFTAEGDPSSGQVNCAVEPARSNAIAHLVYADNCD